MLLLSLIASLASTPAHAGVGDILRQIDEVEAARLNNYERLKAHSTEQNFQRMLVLTSASDVALIREKMEKAEKACAGKSSACADALAEAEIETARIIQGLKNFSRSDAHLSRAKDGRHGYPETAAQIGKILSKLESLADLMAAQRAKALRESIERAKVETKSEVERAKAEAKAKSACATAASSALAKLNEAKKADIEARLKRKPQLYFYAYDRIHEADQIERAHLRGCAPEGSSSRVFAEARELKKSLEKKITPAAMKAARDSLCANAAVNANPELQDGCRRGLQNPDFLASLQEAAEAK